MNAGPPPSRPAAPQRRSGPRAEWREPLERVFLPVLLILAGVAALLVNLGLVPVDRMLRVFDLWPVALVLVGLVLIFRAWLPRVAVPIAAAVAVVFVVGALLYGSLPLGARGTARGADHSAPLGSVTEGRLVLDLGAGSTSVQAEEMGDLYRAHLEYSGGRAPGVQVDGGTVTIGGGSELGPFGGRGGTRARVTLNRSIPWEVHVGGGASRASLELGDVQLTRLDVSGGANHVEATLGPPRGTVAIHVSGGATSVTLHRPTGVPARATMSGGANNLTADGRRYNVVGGDVNWRSPDYDSATDRFDVEISGGASSVTLDQR